MNDRRFDRANGRKPATCSWFRFYVYNPVRSLCCTLGDLIVDAWNVCRGDWYCEYCDKMHGRRVYKHPLTILSDGSVAVSEAGTCEATKLTNAATGQPYGDSAPPRLVCSIGKEEILHNGWRPCDISVSERLQSVADTICKIFR